MFLSLGMRCSSSVLVGSEDGLEDELGGVGLGLLHDLESDQGGAELVLGETQAGQGEKKSNIAKHRHIRTPLALRGGDIVVTKDKSTIANSISDVYVDYVPYIRLTLYGQLW